MLSNEYIIEKRKLHIINEVRRYAKQKKILVKLSNINIEDEKILEEKSLDELVVIYNKSVEWLENYKEELEKIYDYVKLVRKIICKKYEYDNDNTNDECEKIN